MNIISEYLSDALVHSLGMTFLHSIWQGVLAGGFVSLCFYLVKSDRADLRYNISMGTMAVFFLAVCSTFAMTYSEASISNNVNLSSPSELAEPVAEMNLSPDASEKIETDMLGRVQIFLGEHAETLVLFWAVGIMALSIRFAGGFLYIRRLRNIGLTPVPDDWQFKLEEWSMKLRLNKLPSFHESTLVKSPVAFGFIKPMILFPLGMLTSMAVQQLDAMLMHELVHVKNSDYLANLLLSVVEILLFFNPAVWWLSGVMRAEMEHRCDEMAVAMTGSKMNYAYALVAMQENQIYQKSGLAMGMARNSSQLTQRVNRLFGAKGGKSISYGRPLISFFVLLSSVLLLAFSSADETEDELDLTNTAIDSLSNEFYFFNDKPIDESMWVKVQRAHNMGLAQLVEKEGNPKKLYFRFYTMEYIIDAKNQFEEPLPESLPYAREGQSLLVDGKTKLVSELNTSNDSFKNAFYYMTIRFLAQADDISYITVYQQVKT